MCGSAPAAPDPYATAQAQQGLNKDTIIANANVSHVNQNTPFGSLKYTQTGTNSDGTPIWQSDVNLTPDMQKLLNQQTSNMNSQAGTAGSLLANLGQQYAHPQDNSNLPGIASNVKIPGLQTSISGVPGVNYSVADSGNVQGQVASAPGINYGIGDAGQIQRNVPGAGANINVMGGTINGLQNQAQGAGSGIQYDVNGSGSYSQDAQNAANDLLSRSMPTFQYNDNLLRTRLQNQGITPGSEAWNREMQVQGQNYNDMVNQAQLQGYGIQNQLFNQGVTAAGVRNQAQNQNFQQNLANAGLNNEAAKSMYDMTLGNAQFANQGQNTAFNQQLAAANFGNTAQQQQFNQNAQRTDQANQAQQQQYNQNLNNAQFANQAQNQNFTQNMDRTQLANQAQAQQYAQAANNMQMGNAAQQALFGMGQQNAALQNSANAQQLQQNTQLYNQPMNTYNALMSGTQVQTPQFQSYQQGNAQAPNLMGMVQSNYQSQLGSSNNFMSGLFGLGGAALQGAGSAGGFGALFSDRRLKTNIRKIAVTPGGANVYEFRYKGDDKLHIGVMADEVAKVRPDAIHIHESGYMMVDYRKVA